MSEAGNGTRGPLTLMACPSCGHDIGGLTDGAVMVCPKCGASLAAVLAAAEAVRQGEAGPGDDGLRADEMAPALGGHAARGFAFMLAQSLGTRVIAFVCQMVLAWLLLPEHWGTLTLADTIATFANLLQLIGVREVLVARQKKFHVWSNPAFWITTTTGWTTAALVAMVAPLAAHLRGSPDLAGIMLVLALSIPLYSMGIVPEAKLQADLRFRYLALIIAVWATILPVMTVALAWMGFGVYSFVIPRVIAAGVRLAMSMAAARPRIRWRPQLRRWRYIVGSSGLIIFTSLMLLVVQVGDRPLLGLFVGDDPLGIYAFAYAFSLQTIMMISVNLQGVLFATLAKLNDEPRRQLAAFLRASRVLASIVTPICLIQAAASQPLVRTLFSYDKWKDAAIPMAILATGMLFLGAYCPATAMLEAQRRFRTKFFLALANAIVFLGLVLLGTWLGYRSRGEIGAVQGAALGGSITMAILNPIWSYMTTRPLGGTWGDTLGIVSRPLVAGGVAIGLGIAASLLAQRATAGMSVSGIAIEHWVRLFTVCAVSSLVYLALMPLLMPAEFKELAGKVVAIARGASPARAEQLGRLLRVG